MSKIIRGWLFDVYFVPGGVTLWLVDEQGGNHRCFQPFQPSFYMAVRPSDAARVKVLTEKLPVQLEYTVQTELYTGKPWRVLKVTVTELSRFVRVVRTLERFFPHFVFFNSDVSVESMFFYERQLFPLAYGEFKLDEKQNLVSYLVENQFREEYRTPDLRILRLRDRQDFAPRFLRSYNLVVEYDGRSYELNREEPEEILETLNWHLRHYDPDIIETEYGDSLLLPMLTDLAKKCRVPLWLNRDGTQTYVTTKESSFFTYGKIMHKDAAFYLRGRWHLDSENSFILKEGGLHGLFELSRITQIPPQRQARSSIGTGLSSMQLSYAYRNHILIPAKKKEPEDFKTAETLWLSDRGGLSFIPPVGYFEEIGEIDFASMYPSLMVLHNISPETINCPCCPDSKKRVPELNYRICEKRTGLVPATLKPVVERRAYYKKRKKEVSPGSDEYKRYHFMQNTLKWMLVTCFGYLGYRNARFGRIEAHESVNAYARNALLEAKEVAEGENYQLIHGIVDCFWLKKPGTTLADYEELCRKIHAKTGVKVDVDGIYHWILFPASRQDPQIATVNRYVGWYQHEELKVRGLEVRRHDVPGIVSRMQERILDIMSEAHNEREIRDRLPRIFQSVQETVDVLKAGQIPYDQLKIRRVVSKTAEEYRNRNVSAVVLKELQEKGVELAPGESIEYILVKNYARKGQTSELPQAKSYQGYAVGDEYNVDEYGKLLMKAVEVLLYPFGYDWKQLAERFDLMKKVKLLKKNEIKVKEGNRFCFSVS